MLGGFRLNPDSFRPMVSKGVRILKSGFDLLQSNENYLGKLIVGVRSNVPESTFKPVYSIRDFAIWWHKSAQNKTPGNLLCFGGDPCQKKPQDR